MIFGDAPPNFQFVQFPFFLQLFLTLYRLPLSLFCLIRVYPSVVAGQVCPLRLFAEMQIVQGNHTGAFKVSSRLDSRSAGSLRAAQWGLQVVGIPARFPFLISTARQRLQSRTRLQRLHLRAGCGLRLSNGSGRWSPRLDKTRP